MRPNVPGSDPEVTSLVQKSPRSGCRRPISQLFGMFELLQGCNSQDEASRDRKYRDVTEVMSFGPKSHGRGCRRPIVKFWFV